MKPQSKIFEFYKNNLSEFSHFWILPDSFDEEIEEILQRNKTAWPRLVKLCEGDAELMFLCKKYHFSIEEWPTVWHDQAESKLTMRSGFGMLGTLFTLRLQHSFLGNLFAK